MHITFGLPTSLVEIVVGLQSLAVTMMTSKEHPLLLCEHHFSLPFHENVPNYTLSIFATHFLNIEEIPMGHLIDKLKNLRQIENPEHLP
jgi:hypothetical protein